MTNPKCPYCGQPMTLCVDDYSDGTVSGAYCECLECKATSPYFHDCDVDDPKAAALAAYEDSGLSPERAAELGKADAEGRVVIRNPLPPVKGRLFDDISDKLADKANMPCYRCPTCGALVAERSFSPDRDFRFYNFCDVCGQEIAHAEAEAALAGKEDAP